MYVIILNWNGWRDTLECLESVFRLDYSDFRVVVCDNASSDDSVRKIRQWADGILDAEPQNPELSYLLHPSVPKPIGIRQVGTGDPNPANLGRRPELTIFECGANLGFAAGNNMGIRYALGDPKCAFCWILNNDTVVAPDALSALVDAMGQDAGIGLCGSLNLEYFEPQRVQVEGGRVYDPWTARVLDAPDLMASDLPPLKPRMDYVNGSSMFASRSFLERVGLMEESYFLYFEEVDWATRARGLFKLGYARDSVVYHKEGASIGSSQDRSIRSLLSEKYLSRNRVLFTRRFLPWMLPTVLLWILVAAGFRLAKGDGRRAWSMLVWAFKGLVFRGDTDK